MTLDNDNRKANPETDIQHQKKKDRFGGPGKSTQQRDTDFQNRFAPSMDLAAAEVPLPSDRFSAIKGKAIERLPKEVCLYKSAKLRFPAPEADQHSTEGGSNNGNPVGHASLHGTRVRDESMGVCFDAFSAAIAELNCREGYRARLRDAVNTVQFMPLTDISFKAQWSYLDSNTYTKRAVIAADIEYQGVLYTLVDFQLRNSDKCKAGLLRKSSGGYLHAADLEVLLRRVAYKRGVWINADLTELSVEVCALKHTWSDVQKFADAVERKIAEFEGMLSISDGTATV